VIDIGYKLMARIGWGISLEVLRIGSVGKLHETLDHLMIALEGEYIDQVKYEEGKKLILDNIAILNGYINYLERAKGRKYN
jgi:hypothetical protein